MANPPLKRKLVVIEEGTLTSMANNATFLTEFPFLTAIAQQAKVKSGCGGCGRANQERSNFYSAAKAAFARLASDKKRRLKELLNAEKIRITFRDANNKAVQLTF